MFRYEQRRDYDSFVAFDLETSGMGKGAGIIEIGAVKMEFGEITERFDALVDPGTPVSPSVTRLTGITDGMLRGKPRIEEALPVFLDFAGDLPLVAHNARFDCGFLQRAMTMTGLERELAASDTLYLARRTWKLPCYKLAFLAEWFDIEMPRAHRAWCDAETAARLYLMMRG